MFTLAMCVKSESAEYYMITTNCYDMENLEDVLRGEFCVTDDLLSECVGFESDIFDRREVVSLIFKLNDELFEE